MVIVISIFFRTFLHKNERDPHCARKDRRKVPPLLPRTIKVSLFQAYSGRINRRADEIRRIWKDASYSLLWDSGIRKDSSCTEHII